MRINKYLARCGIGSRRDCDEYIKNKQIKVNGKILDNFSYSVKDNDCVQYKNKNINFIAEDYIYIVNKPVGYMCTSDDPKGRKKIIDLIPTNVRLFNIGRLDYNSTGIILLTNNGDIANKLLHPSNQIVKKYYVESKKKLTRKNIEAIEKGLIIPDIGKVQAEIHLLESSKDSFIWDVILREGKNREIRRIFSFLNNQIDKIHRYNFGGIKLGNIKSGKYKRISYKDFNKFLISEKNNKCV
tara:strand:+ start:77 stop:799 length:723 start_codon:yes stop_codon:yes gene_type:complete